MTDASVHELVEAADAITDRVQLCGDVQPELIVLIMRLRRNPGLAFRALFEEWTVEQLVREAY